MKRVTFKTLGCRLNQAETASMAGRFRDLGMEPVPWEEEAHIRVIHSCAVTRAAEQQSLRAVRQAKGRSPAPFVVFTGCVTATSSLEQLRREGADLVVPSSEKFRIPERVAQALDLKQTPRNASLPFFTTTRALVKIQDGCRFRCAYCIVPETRGEPRSRDWNEILEETAAVALQGYREIVLTGVNVGCYHDGGLRLPDLIRAIAALPGVRRIRLSSIEPGTVEREIVDLAVAESGLCRTLHLPLQSGDARILRAMGRRYTPEQYLDSVSYALERIPLLGLGADVITGFPGEDEAAFESTRALVARLPFSNLHVFPYSERPGTPAATMPGSVPVSVRRQRARELLALAGEKRRAFAERFLGREVSVLVERVDARGVGRGWTGEYLEAILPGLPPAAEGTVLRFRPTRLENDRLAADAGGTPGPAGSCGAPKGGRSPSPRHARGADR